MNSQIIALLWTVAILVGIILIMTYFLCRENFPKVIIAGIWYDTSKATRIAGIDEERVNNGQWIKQITSLWRTYENTNTSQCYYFLLKIDELKPAKIVPVTPEFAKSWLRRNLPDSADKLINDWFIKYFESKKWRQ